MTEILSVIAAEDVIIELTAQLEKSGFELDEPQVAESLSDAADGAVGPQEIQYGLQLLTVAIGTATSFAILVDRIIEIRKKIQTLAPIRIVDPKTGEDKAVITNVTSDADARRMAGDLK
ncbi:hypothetical protein OIU34_35425 [Pararhizobium sp. BT-229]|uniref:hypothetical protein n=1 Tax=Pararhizobium sp. BT-229 TaxID=2986923 RepID=UPI0021F7F2AD|nr:hypothetical protein [Pararhizobium sp. BT-229]MCV9967126.1 hypothetical protein [Pararhizobium sp. BT-229]